MWTKWVCKKWFRTRAVPGLLCTTLVGAAGAAPLDALLTAWPEADAPKGFVEVASDRMNGDLDIFNVRNSNSSTAGTPAGDYYGLHISGGFAPFEKTWLSGAYWQRRVSSSSDTYNYDSWQLAGQYRLTDGAGWLPATAVRLSAWGNSAASTESTTAVIVPGARLNSVKITDPSDRNVQADLIGTWALSPATHISVVLGGGSTQLSYGQLTATTTRDGCNYNLIFNGNDIFGTLASPCTVSGGTVQQFYDSSGSYGVNVANEIAYRANFAHAGINATWQRGAWKTSLGYLVTTVQRDSVDAILAARGNAAYTQNSDIVLQLDWRLHPHVRTFGRVQLSSNLFFTDMPVTYNSSTAYRFDSKYSLFTVGMMLDF